MYIKQITIQGFKSYKDQITFDPFSPKHNVIVGRNGSGKSNFFSAIRFVLGDAYQSLSKEERQSLLHEGTGSATISAYVEVVFDNSDNRFPTGKDEVVLRRSIGLTLDEYSLDKKSVTKTDVMSLLESAGFSRSNPYYIVPQGRITSLTVARDEDRLQLLKEIAGTRVYEQKRSESHKIIEETDAKRSKITEVLEYIEERLAELEKEKEELSQFQTLDRQRRSLEYTIYMREQMETNEKLGEMEESRRVDVISSENKRKEQADNEVAINTLEVSIRDKSQEMNRLETEKYELLEDKEEYVKAKAKLEMLVMDLESSELSEQEYKTRLDAQLEAVANEMKQVEQAIADITPRVEQLIGQDGELRHGLKRLLVKQQNIHAKQARLTRFNSKAERDQWLQSEINEIQGNLTIRNNQITILETEKQEAEKQVAERIEYIQKIREKLAKRQDILQKLAEEELKLKQERDDATEQRKKLWRQEAKLDSVLHNCTDEARKAERMLASSVDKATSSGLEAVSRIAQAHNIHGVYGPVFDLFTVDERFNTAVETAAGSSLFHIVVENDTVATELLTIINQEKAGRVTFMPLNRIRSSAVTYPTATDAIPLIQRLSYDTEKFQAVFEHVFGGVIVCPNLDVAASYSKTHNLNVVTLEGDRVDRRGTLFGGYMDMRHSRLEAAKAYKMWKSKLAEERERGAQLKQQIGQLDQEVTRILSDLQVVESKRKQLQIQGDTSFHEAKLRKEEETIKQLVFAKEKTLTQIRANAAALDQQIATYQAEISTEPSQTLSAEEQQILSENSKQIESMKQRMAEVSAAKVEAENEINTLNDRLEHDLKRRQEELQSKTERATADSSSKELERKRKEIKWISKKQDRFTQRITELETLIDKHQQDLQGLTQSLEQLTTEQADVTRTISKHEKNLERYLLRRSLLLQRKEDCSVNIRDLGILPDDAQEKYAKLNIGKLLRKLHRANESLQKYGHVNKKAFEQYGIFTKQRDQLTTRKTELDKSASSIRGLVDSLDRRKDEAIERTFQQVAGNFAEIFETLVPAGRGELVIQRKSDQDMEVDGEEDGTQRSIERYSGVAIKVSFNSKSDEGTIMQQLSGGQKSLVALALIFAIQKCDPAPFYLFDEIDANLDVQYRTAVAEMIHANMSSSAQFITTTFRPELLANADKFYGVTFQGKVSRIHAISKESALGFVEQEHAH
ncbi:chromosome segregation protein sudA [Zychaea mexicana]|uniref:chromosome segregation protein sudA n=1 Tax=Zychaea mexicana TaxID=64656 RepID=UPI0022FEBFE8|nr:chromosome segregation protein sudA [Zychaea mexicana]KAI9490283.1 chromosome segregation protein sudA [Zychaea mexicana]